jgi:hypothetical protein
MMQQRLAARKDHLPDTQAQDRRTLLFEQCQVDCTPILALPDITHHASAIAALMQIE